ncbi:MAG: hypothetical protein WCY77_04785 [Weeksellaceae bacterium]
MKFLKYAFVVLASTLTLSCSDDDDNPNPTIIDETADLILAKTFSNSNHTLAVYTHDGKFTEGYNRVFFQLKDSNNDYVSNATFNWKPMMHMTNMMHSGPHSTIGKVPGKQTLYEAYVVFQMAGNNSEYWELKFNYTVNGLDYEMVESIDVNASTKRRVVSFMGSDDQKYIIAYMEPSSPKVAVNDMVAGVFKMESMMDFPMVNQFKVKIDPRMPGMGNHGSPNNVDLTQNSNGLYQGKLSLTMSGYWKINLMLENQNGEILKGEPVTDSNESSSIYFEIEF